MVKVHPSAPLLPAALLERAEKLSSSALSDAMGGHGVMEHGLCALVPGTVLAGTALTVSLEPGGNYMVHHAIAQAGPGYVLVIDNRGNTSVAVIGGMMALAMRQKNIAGVVVDGMVRDLAVLRRIGLPIFSRGGISCAIGTVSNGTVNAVTSCAGVLVSSGDLIMADDDGVIAVPREAAERMVASAEKKQAAEMERTRVIEAGDLFPKWAKDQAAEHGLRL